MVGVKWAFVLAGASRPFNISIGTHPGNNPKLLFFIGDEDPGTGDRPLGVIALATATVRSIHSFLALPLTQA